MWEMWQGRAGEPHSWCTILAKCNGAPWVHPADLLGVWEPKTLMWQVISEDKWYSVIQRDTAWYLLRGSVMMFDSMIFYDYCTMSMIFRYDVSQLSHIGIPKWGSRLWHWSSISILNCDLTMNPLMYLPATWRAMGGSIFSWEFRRLGRWRFTAAAARDQTRGMLQHRLVDLVGECKSDNRCQIIATVRLNNCGKNLVEKHWTILKNVECVIKMYTRTAKKSIKGSNWLQFSLDRLKSSETDGLIAVPTDNDSFIFW